MKELDLNKSVFELTEAYPELITILKDLGFFGVANVVARKTLGRVTTIPQGCQKQGQDLAKVVKQLEEAGFKVKSST